MERTHKGHQNRLVENRHLVFNREGSRVRVQVGDLVGHDPHVVLALLETNRRDRTRQIHLEVGGARGGDEVVGAQHRLRDLVQRFGNPVGSRVRGVEEDARLLRREGVLQNRALRFDHVHLDEGAAVLGALDDGRALVHAAAEPVRLVPGVVAVAAVALGLGVGGVARQVLAGRVADALGLKLVDRPVVRALVHIHDLDGACLGEAGATRDPGRVDGVGHGVEAALHGHPADQPGGVVVVDLEATNQVVEVLVDNRGPELVVLVSLGDDHGVGALDGHDGRLGLVHADVLRRVQPQLVHLGLGLPLIRGGCVRREPLLREAVEAVVGLVHHGLALARGRAHGLVHAVVSRQAGAPCLAARHLVLESDVAVAGVLVGLAARDAGGVRGALVSGAVVRVASEVAQAVLVLLVPEAAALFRVGLALGAFPAARPFEGEVLPAALAVVGPFGVDALGARVALVHPGRVGGVRALVRVVHVDADLVALVHQGPVRRLRRHHRVHGVEADHGLYLRVVVQHHLLHHLHFLLRDDLEDNFGELVWVQAIIVLGEVEQGLVVLQGRLLDLLARAARFGFVEVKGSLGRRRGLGGLGFRRRLGLVDVRFVDVGLLVGPHHLRPREQRKCNQERLYAPHDVKERNARVEIR
mmetsp:Transcript_9314/g.21043  ORF Transcript_9314/g.21043 Transcript_9314/m.21043 type:complete len:641 (+) Transcript_9314:798-2720(+)